MRIIQPCGPSHRDDGNPFYLMKYFNAMEGITCDRFPVTARPEEWGEYDAIVYADWGQDNWCFDHLPPFVCPTGKPSLCWQSDTHWTEGSKWYRFEQAREYTSPAFCQLNAAQEWKEKYGKACFWLPHAVDPSIYGCASVPVPPAWDWCFIGHMDDPDRRESLKQLIAAHGDHCFLGSAFFEECAKIYVQSKVVFNKSVRGELNMRTFEAMSTRSFLLTDRQNGMKELGLEDGVHAALYDTMDEAIEKMSYYLSRPAEREAIADAGYRFVLSGHTFAHRARSILAMLQSP